MTALLEMKQNIKHFYGKYEMYILPILKFLLAMTYFFWINLSLGFSSALDSIFVVLILALLCAILPTNTIMLMGFALIIGHCYALNMIVAAFAFLLIILMMVLFLRFSASANLVVVFSPLGFAAHVPAVVPIGGGLLGGPLTAAPAAGGVILYYFIRLVSEQASVLQSEDTEVPQKLKVMLDGLMKNQEMWITVGAFVIVSLLVYILRTRSMDYAWRVGIGVGVVTYVFILFVGALFLDVNLNYVSLAISAVCSVILGFILEFFVFGGDYTRTESLAFEDDDYYYYVKAVPKVSVGISSRQIKKINGRQEKKEVLETELKVMSVIDEVPPVVNSFPEEMERENQIQSSENVIAPQEEVDFEKKLEESLKDL